MSKRITLLLTVAALFLFAGGVRAGTRLKVNRDDLWVSAPNKANIVTVSGKPRCVLGAHPIKVTVYNRTGENSSEGTVEENGSFSVTIPGYGKDKLKITFTADNGKKKAIKMKVPPPSIFPW